LLPPDPSLCIPSLVSEREEDELASLLRECAEPEETILKLFLRRGIEGDTVVLICGRPEIGIRAVAVAAVVKAPSASNEAGRPEVTLETGPSVSGRDAGAEVEGFAESGIDIELAEVLPVAFE
jgi:hypothetical protein